MKICTTTKKMWMDSPSEKKQNFFFTYKIKKN